MTTISDQSDVATWSWQVWALFIACVLIVLLGWWLVGRLMAAAPMRDSEPSGIDRLDGKGRAL